MQHAQQYLARVLPWPQEGDEPAYVNIEWSTTRLHPTSGKPLWNGRACRSVQEAVNTVGWALKLEDTKDIYVCLSTQRRADERTAKTSGRTYLRSIRGQENAVALKSLFLDIDAKPGPNGYADMNEAVTALGNFLKAVNLPKPSLVVSSGGGLHVYWTLTRPLPLHEWQPLAYALAEATKRHGLKCDTQCTIDGARILRVPDTFNRKNEEPRPVRLAGTPTDFDYTVERMAQALEPYKTITPSNPLPPRMPLKGPSDLSAGVDMGASAPADLKSVARSCGFIRDAIITNGKDLANPLWNLTTLISTFAQNGRAMAHVMGMGHPGYTKESTDELYDRKERERQNKGLGWPSCKTISASGSTWCQGCPHFAAGRSPLNLATKAAPSVAAAGVSGVLGATALQPGHAGLAGRAGQGPRQDDLPAGYVRRADNVVCIVVLGNDGATQTLEPISTYPMWEPRIQKQPHYTLNFMSVTETGRTTQIALPLKEASTADGLKRLLWGQGLPLRPKETKGMMDFMVSWIEKLQKDKQRVVNSAPFGWAQRGGITEGFVYGGQLWTPNGPSAAANPDPLIASQYEPVGEKDPWIIAANMITSQGRPQLDAIIASAFAAPLVKFTNEQGILISTYSQESGIGKTTTMRIAQAVWGDPSRAMQGLNDTQNSVVGKIGELRSLPMYWDELKSEEDTKRFVKLVFQLTQGREKARMTQAVTQRAQGTWRTMLISASNDSIVDHVMAQSRQTTAGINRVFEYEVAPAVNNKGQINPADAQKIVGALDDNYGVVGREYAEWLGLNHKMLEKEVFEFHRDTGAELGMSAEERYWQVTISTLLLGARYANKLGYTAIDEVRLKSFLAGVIKRMRGDKANAPVDMKKAGNISNTLAQFLNAMRARHTLKTNQIHVGRGKPAAGSIKVLNDASKLDAIYVHIGQDDKLLRMSSTQLSQWLSDRGDSRHLFMRALEQQMGAKSLNARIGAGTQYAGATEYIIEIDLKGSTVLNFLDET
jgi:hypothetical protein